MNDLAVHVHPIEITFLLRLDLNIAHESVWSRYIYPKQMSTLYVLNSMCTLDVALPL